MSDIRLVLEGLQLAALAELAERLLPPLVGIDDPKAAASRVAELAELPQEATSELEALAQQTGQSSLGDLTAVLRPLLEDVAANEPEGEAAMSQLAEELGRKQIVVGPELYGICALLLAGYVVVRTGGKTGKTREIDISEAPDGRTRVKIRERIEYLNPFGSLSQLLKRVVGSDESCKDT
jgi:hypothetical protein